METQEIVRAAHGNNNKREGPQGSLWILRTSAYNNKTRLSFSLDTGNGPYYPFGD